MISQSFGHENSEKTFGKLASASKFCRLLFLKLSAWFEKNDLLASKCFVEKGILLVFGTF